MELILLALLFIALFGGIGFAIPKLAARSVFGGYKDLGEETMDKMLEKASLNPFDYELMSLQDGYISKIRHWWGETEWYCSQGFRIPKKYHDKIEEKRGELIQARLDQNEQ